MLHMDGIDFNFNGFNYGVRKSGQSECENFYGFLQIEFT